MDPRSWFSLLRVFSFREKVFVGGLLVLLIFALGYWGYSVYRHFTEVFPDYGGKYTEGAIGQPSHINPVLSQANPVDADLVELMYSGLVRYDESGNIVPDLAKEWEVSEDGKTYTVFLRREVTWHDGEDVKADDVIFTVDIIRDPLYKSPLRLKWPELDRIEQLDEHTVRFALKEPYPQFLENLTVGILPKHVWEQVTPDRFPLSVTNLEPVGSGPYVFLKHQKDSDGNIVSYEMGSFKEYMHGRPYISLLSFHFYATIETLAMAYENREIHGASMPDRESLKVFEEGAKNLLVHEFSTPQYYITFFNHTKNRPLAYEEVRRALALATNRKRLVETILGGRGLPVQGPFLPGDAGYRDDHLEMNFGEAEHLLEGAGWKRGEDGVRVREEERLAFTLMTLDLPTFAMAAEELAHEWEALGADVRIEMRSPHELRQNHIQPREYEALLYVQAPGSPPNLYSYWHESQKGGSGYNLSVYSTDELDAALEALSTNRDQDKSVELYTTVQDILLDKNPAVFLFSPYQLYPMNERVQGMQVRRTMNAEDRFGDVHLWYIETKRMFKNGEQ